MVIYAAQTRGIFLFMQNMVGDIFFYRKATNGKYDNCGEDGDEKVDNILTIVVMYIRFMKYPSFDHRSLHRQRYHQTKPTQSLTRVNSCLPML